MDTKEVLGFSSKLTPGTALITRILKNHFKKMPICFSYESTIAAQFFGHTHYDEFELFYDSEDKSRATSIAYVGPSVTPYYNLNPGYRIYYVDGDRPQSTRVI